MKKAIRAIAAIAGIETSYHVSAIYKDSSGSDFSFSSMQIKMTPWLHDCNYSVLTEEVHKSLPTALNKPVIVGITKL